MPVGFSSPARNLFLLGSTGAQVVSNFFESVSKASTTDGVFIPDEIRYIDINKKYALAGSAADSNSKGFGWLERQDYDLETGNLTTDYSVRIESPQAGVTTTLRAMELDSNNNLIVAGFTGTVPWIAKYSNDGVLDWQSTTNSANVRYLGVTSDSSGNYYACGRTSLTAADTQAFVEKFDSNGNPGWGKQAFMLGRDVVLEKISANDRGEVVAVGFLEDDSADKGYIVKIDTATGEVLWDRTLERNISGYGGGFSPDDIAPANVKCTACYIDSLDQIYVVGTIDGNSPVDNGVGEFLIKYSPEGNIIWQRERDTNHYTILDGAPNTVPFDVKSDGETEQTVVLSVEDYGSFALFDADIFISKYSKNGDLVFRRKISKGNDNLGAACLDADPSFYYIMFRDQRVDALAGEPDRYTFGKVSTSGNGLGDFEYNDGTATLIDYTAVVSVDGSPPPENKIGRLSDGSVTNSVSDLMTYPFNANKLLFDDLATQVSNKKRQMDSADSFEYSGSPAIRPADFQEMNLLGDKIRIEETVSGGSGNVLVSDEVNITASDPAAGGGDKFGFSVAVGSGRIVVGATGIASNDGAAYIFDLDGNQLTKITTSGTAGTDYFGDSVSVGSGKIVVGGKYIGAAYVYDLDGTNEVEITVSDAGSADNFGDSVAVGSSKIVVGCPRDDDNGNESGAAYVFNLDGSGEVKFTPSDPAALDFFGSKVAVGSSKIVVGCPLKDVNSTNDGAAYIFDLDGNQLNKLSLSDGGYQRNFGSSVAVGSSRIVVGARGENGDIGAAYIFDLDGNQLHRIAASDGAPGDEFGDSVSIGNNKIVVGAHDADSSTGAAYVYNLDGSGEVKITASNGDAGDEFGFSVAVGSGVVVVGSSLDDTSNGTESGSAYIYPLDVTKTTTTTLWEDESGKGNDGTADVQILVEDETEAYTAQNGPTHNAAGYWEFDGVNDYITLPKTTALANWYAGPYSIEMWFRADNLNLNSNNKGPLIGLSDVDSNGEWWSLGWNNSNVFNFYYWNGSQQNVAGSTTLSTATWYHAVFTHDSGTTTLYLNGSQDGTVSVVGTPQFDLGSQFDLTVGVSANGYHDGRVGEVRIYPRALKATQVFQNYNSTKSKYINEAPDTAPKIGPGIVYDSNLLLNYDFGNRATYDRVENLYTGSDDLKDWVLGTNDPSITRNLDVVSPHGTTDAVLVENNGVRAPGNSTSIGPRDKYNFENGKTYTFSGHFKLPEGVTSESPVNDQLARIALYDSQFVWSGAGGTITGVTMRFNLITGEVNPLNNAYRRSPSIDYGMSYAGNGWWRCWITELCISNHSSRHMPIRVVYNNNSGFLVWGFQLNEGGISRYVRSYENPITAPTTVKNLSSSSIDGTINGATFDSSGYFEFDGVNNYIDLGSNATLQAIGSNATIECWFKATADAFNIMVGWGEDGQNFYSNFGVGNWFSGQPDESIWVGYNNGSNTLFYEAGGHSKYNDNNWHHAVATIGPNNHRIYVDGSQVTTVFQSGADTDSVTNIFRESSSVKVFVGARPYQGGSGFFNGNIPQVRIYDRILTATEVSQNFNATRSKYGV